MSMSANPGFEAIGYVRAVTETAPENTDAGPTFDYLQSTPVRQQSGV